MLASLGQTLLFSLAFTQQVFAGYDPNLVGTWSTKSKKVLTGPVSASQTMRSLDNE